MICIHISSILFYSFLFRFFLQFNCYFKSLIKFHQLICFIGFSFNEKRDKIAMRLLRLWDDNELLLSTFVFFCLFFRFKSYNFLHLLSHIIYLQIAFLLCYRYLVVDYKLLIFICDAFVCLNRHLFSKFVCN